MWRRRLRRGVPTGDLAELAATPTWMYEWELGGFSRVQALAVPAGMNPQYTEGHRLVVAAWP
jgi:hypothetical protein